MAIRKTAVNASLLLTSTALSIILINIIYIILIREPRQSRGFPRHLIPDLPPPSRWLYADTGSKGNRKDIALLGDSYLEAIGDDFSDGLYNYSLAHFLHERTGLQIAQYGTSGSFLPRQLALYQKALAGDYWPLHDRIDEEKIPGRLIAFFYEGNDLDDIIAARYVNSSDQLNADLPLMLRYFPAARLVSRRFDRLVGKINSKIYYLTDNLLSRWPMVLTLSRPSGLAPANGFLAKPVGDPSRISLETALGNKGESICGPHYCLPTGQSLQGPALGLTGRQRAQATQATVASVIQYARQNPARQVCLVYVPSPAVIYAPLMSTSLNRKHIRSTPEAADLDRKYDIITKISQSIRIDMIKQLQGSNVRYVDTTPRLVESAKAKYLHGRQDVNHFNRYGYRSVVDSIVTSGLKCLTKAT